MYFTDTARAVSQKIVRAFESGQIPAALAQTYLTPPDIPCRAWSIRNRILAALAGHTDARGYRQWQEAGRQVKRGESSFHIFAPITRRAAEDDPEVGVKEGDPLCTGFRALPVFGLSQTEGNPIPYDNEHAEHLRNLPLIEVAHTWGINVTPFAPGLATGLGFYRPGQIGIGVKNLRVWAHELVHAADDRREALNKALGQQVDNEIVADLGGATLLEVLGYEAESDRGSVWAYIKEYAEGAKVEPIQACGALLDRTAAAVGLILQEGYRLAEGPAGTAE